MHENERAHEAIHQGDYSRFLIENITGYAVFSLDLQGKISSWNTGAERLLGYAENEVIGKHFSLLFVPEDIAAGRPATELRTAATEGSVSDKNWVVRKDGSRFWGVGFTYPLHDSGLLGYVKVFRDLTEIHQHEQKLREMEHRFRHMADHAPVFIWTARNDGSRDYLNKSWRDFTGRSLEQEIGLGWLDDVHPDDLRRLRDVYERAFAAKRAYRIEYRLRRGDGEFRWILDHGVPRYSPDDTFQGYIGSCTDIHDRKQLEQALGDRNEQLEEMDRRRNEVLAMLGHELRNPLAPIVTALTIMRQEKSGPILDQARTIMERQVRHLVRLVDDLLDMARITRGRIELRKERVELNDLIDRAVESVGSLVAASQHDLSVSAPRGAIWIDADPARIQQVLVNLLSNACKYTPPKGHIRLTVQLEGDKVSIAVRDNGVGIAPDTIGKVFDLFTQAERSLARSEGGLGIGLTMAKKLVEMHGGRITAQSAGLGMGSEFTIRLSVARVERTVSAIEKVASGDGAEQARRRVAALRILIVDDNVDAAISLAILLEAFGHEVVGVAHDGPAAVKSILARKPAVVLLDIGLPGMNGYEVAERVREQMDHPPNFVAITGYALEADKMRAKEAGIAHHMVKPVNPDHLQELLDVLASRPAN